MDQDQKKYEAETVVTGEGESIADLRKIADRVFDPADWKDPSDWKAPWAAYVPHQLVGAVMRAVEFFHADRAEVVGTEKITGRVLMRGRGYQAY